MDLFSFMDKSKTLYQANQYQKLQHAFAFYKSTLPKKDHAFLDEYPKSLSFSFKSIVLADSNSALKESAKTLQQKIDHLKAFEHKHNQANLSKEKEDFLNLLLEIKQQVYSLEHEEDKKNQLENIESIKIRLKQGDSKKHTTEKNITQLTDLIQRFSDETDEIEKDNCRKLLFDKIDKISQSFIGHENQSRKNKFMRQSAIIAMQARCLCVASYQQQKIKNQKKCLNATQGKLKRLVIGSAFITTALILTIIAPALVLPLAAISGAVILWASFDLYKNLSDIHWLNKDNKKTKIILSDIAEIDDKTGKIKLNDNKSDKKSSQKISSFFLGNKLWSIIGFALSVVAFASVLAFPLAGIALGLVSVFAIAIPFALEVKTFSDERLNMALSLKTINQEISTSLENLNSHLDNLEPSQSTHLSDDIAYDESSTAEIFHGLHIHENFQQQAKDLAKTMKQSQTSQKTPTTKDTFKKLEDEGESVNAKSDGEILTSAKPH